MNNRNLTFKIFPEDCVGDSVGKHNYNLISLDSQLCELSSMYFNDINSFYNIFTLFSANTAVLIDLENNFSDISRVSRATTTVRLLSSYWQDNQFTVHYPLNISTLNNQKFYCLTEDENNDVILKSLGKKYLTNNYPASAFNNQTIVNVMFFFYSTNVPVNLDRLTSFDLPDFTYVKRNTNSYFARKDIHLSEGKMLSFYNNINDWVYLETNEGNTEKTIHTDLTELDHSRIEIRPNPNGRITIDVELQKEDHYNYDLFYRITRTGLYSIGQSDIILHIHNNTKVGSTKTSEPALIVSGFSTGDTVTIINDGYILGCGGNGGNGQNLGTSLTNNTNGNDGGDAIVLRYPTTIINNGIIGGGGGGGAGSLATYSDANTVTSIITHQGTVDINELIPDNYTTNVILGGGNGGGGGAGFLGGDEGLGGIGIVSNTSTNSAFNGLDTLSQGDDGNVGSVDSNGSGGNSTYY
jgi:hypothetical protein